MARAAGSFVPCSSKHKSCSPFHAEMVRGYQLARYNEEIQLEMILSNDSERELWKANGGKIIDFKQWLIGHKGHGNRRDEGTDQAGTGEEDAEDTTESASSATGYRSRDDRQPSDRNTGRANGSGVARGNGQPTTHDVRAVGAGEPAERSRVVVPRNGIGALRCEGRLQQGSALSLPGH